MLMHDVVPFSSSRSSSSSSSYSLCSSKSKPLHNADDCDCKNSKTDDNTDGFCLHVGRVCHGG